MAFCVTKEQKWKRFKLSFFGFNIKPHMQFTNTSLLIRIRSPLKLDHCQFFVELFIVRIIELIHLRLLFPRNPRRRECRTSPTASPHGSTSASASTSTTPSPTGCSPAPWYWGSWKRSGTNATKESELGKTEYCWSGGHCLGKGMGYFFLAIKCKLSEAISFSLP